MKLPRILAAAALALVAVSQPFIAAAQPRFNPGGIPAYDSAADALRHICVDQAGTYIGCGGSGTGLATEVTLASVLTALNTQVTGLPAGDPAAKASTVVTRGGANISSATDTALITATASQTGRLLDLFCTVDGAQTLTFKDGSSTFTGGGPFRIPSGGGVLQLPYVQHGYFETTANTALNLTTSTSANVNCRFFYKKD